MKKFLEIYNPEKTYIYPNKQLATPEHIQMEFSMVNIPGMVCVIETDEDHLMFYTFPDPIRNTARRYEIDPDAYQTDEALVEAIEEKMNEPLPDPEPTAEDRIAAAMEYQNLLSM